MSTAAPITSLPTATAKPLLRGVSHQIAVFVALIAGAMLTLRAAPGAARWSVAVFGGCMVTQLGISALYHRIDWSEPARLRMRRLDHSAIFILIAGGYTPLFALVPTAAGGHLALAGIWIGAGLGVVKSLLWPHAPRWITAALCVGLGWLAAGQVVERAAIVGWITVSFLIASGVVYSLGAAVYALKRPNPAPRVFGYHEVFHAFVLVASVLLFTHVVLVLQHAAVAQ